MFDAKLLFSSDRTFLLNDNTTTVQVNVVVTKKLSCSPHLSTDLLPLRKLIEVSFTGTIRENGRTQSFGQIDSCLASENDLPEDLKKILPFWKEYHLNAMKAGTRIQDACLAKYMVGSYDYNKACDVLKEHNLYIDRGYSYGHSWLYQKIPSKDLRAIIQLFS